MKKRPVIKNRLIILMLFSFLCLVLFWGENNTVFAQNQQRSQEALAPPSAPGGTFTFLTEISVEPGDTFVDIDWTPYWQEEIRRPSTMKGFKRLLGETAKEGEIKRLAEETLKTIPERKEISGYIIYYGKESRKYTRKVDVGNVTKYRIRGLNNYTTYFFSIQAYTVLREFSEPSDEVFTTPKPEEELLSAIEKGFSKEKVPQVISRKVKQFGYDFFPSRTPGFTPLADATVGPDYIIGPGDGFTISIWGRIEGTFSVEVDRNGGIILPKVGVIKVWGLTFSELKKTIHKRFSEYYTHFQMNITMDRLRTIRIYVVGEANKPGSYMISSVSTVYSALISAGGPSKKGTMRSIQLIRNGNVIKTIDLYDFLLKGNKSQDERLQSGDTIFIPVIGSVVGIIGNVKRPAIYEMKKPMKLEEVIGLAGGITFLGYLQRVQIERIEAHQKKVIADLDISESLKDEWPQLSTPLQDGDLVKIFPILPTTHSIVYLEGHVKRPGGYEFKEGMKLLDIVKSFDELLPEPYLDYADIIRLVPPDFHPETISFNLEGLLKGDLSQNIELKEHDTVTVYSRNSFIESPRVTISGEVQRPGKYQLVENMKVKELIYIAGNLKRSAYLPEAEITRLIKTKRGVKSKIINIDLGEALKEDPKHNIPLKEDDYLFVRQIPEWYTDKTVILRGEVKFPGVYSFSKGEMLSSVLERAGGFTKHAYLKGVFFTRRSVKKIQEERINGFIDRLEEGILRAQTRLTEATIAEAEAKGLEQSLAAKRELLRKTRTSQATGRVVITLDSLDKFKGSKYDLKLEDVDKLTIPPIPGIVNILGSVYNPTSIVYTIGKKVGFYLNKVGGPTPDAEEEEIYIVRADGTVISKTQKGTSGISWDSEGRRWIASGFMSTLLNPGDTILVPSRITRIVWKKEFMDWTSVMYQLAVTAGVIVALY